MRRIEVPVLLRVLARNEAQRGARSPCSEVRMRRKEVPVLPVLGLKMRRKEVPVLPIMRER